MASRFPVSAPPSRLRNFTAPSVWLEFSPLAKLTSSHNLGQGFPTFPPPPFITEALSQSTSKPTLAQYARPAGHPRLVSAIAQRYNVKEKQVVVTVGASEAILLGVMATVDVGMEVVLIEPAFDIYKGAVELCGGVCKAVGLKWKSLKDREMGLSGLKIDEDELRGVLSDKTRLLILNSPHNPTGKVFAREEMGRIATILEDYPHVCVLSDEVYEKLVYPPNVHVPFASISESAAARTISVYSAGKMFSVTGWKVGWAVSANEELAQRLAIVQQFVVFSVATPLQECVAIALETSDRPYEGCGSFYEYLRANYERKRKVLMEALQEAKLNPIEPQGAFYIMAETLSIKPRHGHNEPPPEIMKWINEGDLEVDDRTFSRKDYNIAREMAVTTGIVGIPPSAFYDGDSEELGDSPKDGPTSLARDFIRLAFCKTDEELKEAAEKIVQGNVDPESGS